MSEQPEEQNERIDDIEQARTAAYAEKSLRDERIDDIDLARGAAYAEKPLRDLARRKNVGEKEKARLDKLAKKRGEKYITKEKARLDKLAKKRGEEYTAIGGKKISLPEALIMVEFCIFADLAEIFFDFFSTIPFLAPISVFVGWIIVLFTFGLVWFWLIIKGELGVWFIAGSLMEMIPYINALPLLTISILAVIYLVNHPKLAHVAAMAVGKLKK